MGHLLSFLDIFLKWTLYLGPFWTITVLALLTGLMIVLAQKYFTDQRLMGLLVQDTRVLKKLAKAAKKEKEKERVQRYQRRLGTVTTRRVLKSMKPVFFIIVPIMLLVTWCQNRLAYLPLRPQQEVEVRAYFCEGAEGHAHIVPADGLSLRQGQSYIQLLQTPEAEAAGAQLYPFATWHLHGEAGRYSLNIRYEGKTYVTDLVITEGVEQTPALQYHVPPGDIASPNKRSANSSAELPPQEGLLWVEFGLQENFPIKLGKVRLNWMWSFLSLAMTFGLGLRFLLRVK